MRCHQLVDQRSTCLSGYGLRSTLHLPGRTRYSRTTSISDPGGFSAFSQFRHDLDQQKLKTPVIR